MKLEATGEDHDLLFLDGEESAERARAKAEQNLLQKSCNVVLPVPCPNCGSYQEDMSQRLKQERSINSLQIAGAVIAALSLVPLAFSIPHFWLFTIVLAVAGLALLAYGYVVAFGFDPNTGDPETKKALGRKHAVWGEQLVELLTTMPTSSEKPVLGAPLGGSEKSVFWAAERPVWAATFPVSRAPIQMCSGLTPETMFRGDTRQQKAAGAQPVEAFSFGAGAIQPAAGAVPWPAPSPAGAQLITFWGTGSGHTREFALPSDGALRIVTRGGLIKLRVRRQDGGFLGDSAHLDGQQIHLGIMAIPVSGIYSLVVEAAAEVDWGATILYQGPASGE